MKVKKERREKMMSKKRATMDRDDGRGKMGRKMRLVVEMKCVRVTGIQVVGPV